MNKNHYFYCDWHINTTGIDFIPELHDTAFDLGCVLTRQGFKTNEGLQMSRFMIGVDSIATLRLLIQKKAWKMGLVEWTPLDISTLDYEFPQRMMAFEICQEIT